MKEMFRLFLLCGCILLINTAPKGEQEVTPEPKEKVDLHIELDSPNIHILSKSNFTTFSDNNKPFLALFYATWCTHCKSVAPEYVKAANALAEKNSIIKVAAINCVVEEEVCDRNFIRGFPTIKLFQDSMIFQYDGGRDYKEIMRFGEKEVFGSYKTILKVDEIERKVKEKTVVLVSTMDKTEYETEMIWFKDLSNRYDRLFFAHCPSDECREKYQANVVMLRTFDEPMVVLPEPITPDAFFKFIEYNSLEIGGGFNILATSIIFSMNKTSIFFFRNESDPISAEKDKIFKAIGKDYKEKLHFFTVDVGTRDPVQRKAGEFFFVTPEKQPHILIHTVKNDESMFYGMEIYLMDNIKSITDVTEEGIRQFIQDFQDGKLEREPNSEIAPQGQNEDFTVVVARTFKELVIQNSKTVIVLFIGKECVEQCENVHKFWRNLGKKYNKESDEIEFAIMDLTINEVRGFTVEKFPTILMFKVGQKDKAILFEGTMKSTAVEEWVARNVGWIEDTKKEEQKSEDL